jgi:hypothetical protein
MIAAGAPVLAGVVLRVGIAVSARAVVVGAGVVSARVQGEPERLVLDAVAGIAVVGVMVVGGRRAPVLVVPVVVVPVAVVVVAVLVVPVVVVPVLVVPAMVPVSVLVAVAVPVPVVVGVSIPVLVVVAVPVGAAGGSVGIRGTRRGLPVGLVMWGMGGLGAVVRGAEPADGDRMPGRVDQLRRGEALRTHVGRPLPGSLPP